MRRVLPLLIAGLLLPTAVPVHAADTVLLRLFRDYVEALRIQAGIPGLAVALVADEGIVWEQAFGRQDVARAIPTRLDTPFHVDGLTQVFTATLILRCVEEGRLSLDDRIGQFAGDSLDANLTIRELLTHTSTTQTGVSFAYRTERLEPLANAVRACTNDSYRESLADLLNRLGMRDSVPGPDVVRLVPPAEGIPDEDDVDRYEATLDRLATPYVVDPQRRATPTFYPTTTLTAGGGLISTVHDLAQFDLALRRGVLLRPQTLLAAWTPPPALAAGRPLTHGLGWFADTHNGEKLVWQFGVGATGSSSLIVTLPARGLTFILLANSTGLIKPFPLTAADLVTSPFVRLFLGFSAG